MATIQERYAAASAYIRRAVDTTKMSAFNPIRYLRDDPARVAASNLEKLEARWLRASNDLERAAVARDTELLADRVEENLPGAPQDRNRTNLYPGEVQRSTPAISFLTELEKQARSDWHWFTDSTSDAAHKTTDGLKLVAVCAGLYLAIKALDAAAPRRDGRATTNELNRQLEKTADESVREGVTP